MKSAMFSHLGFAFAVLACASLPYMAQATNGVDMSSDVYQNSFKCLKNQQGVSFAIPRCYRSTNKPDTDCPHTIYNAWDGGMSGMVQHVDIYMFPCPKCGNPEKQVKSMLDNLSKYGISNKNEPPKTYGMVWLDIEGSQYWHSSHQSNRNFFNGLISELEKKDQVIGVYTSKSQWEPIMGDWHGGGKYPLWYAHYDGRKSFSDFTPFGGWSKPNMKQYKGSTNVCSAGVDLNWYP